MILDGKTIYRYFIDKYMGVFRLNIQLTFEPYVPNTQTLFHSFVVSVL